MQKSRRGSLWRPVLSLIALLCLHLFANAQEGCDLGSCVEFLDGSVLFEGSSNARGDDDTGVAFFDAERFSAAAHGLTSAGFGDDFAESSADLLVSILRVDDTVCVDMQGVALAIARASGTRGRSSAFGELGAGFLLQVEQTSRFWTESNLLNSSVGLEYEIGGPPVIGDRIEAGVYWLWAQMEVFAFTEQGVYTDEASIDWTLTLDPIPPCRVDMDGDGEATIFDFLVFLNLFDAGDLRADFDGDGDLTIFDFLVFGTEFDAGCG